MAGLLTMIVAMFAADGVAAQGGPATCSAERAQALVPSDPARCARLAKAVRDPSALPLDEYETLLGDFLRDFCHRDAAAGWQRDKGVRDVGPFIATLSATSSGSAWSGKPFGTHEPVVIWYSAEMIDWMDRSRPPEEADAPEHEEPVPDGAIMIKEMFPAPAATCAGIDPLHLLPTSGAAVMVRDRDASVDGWFWGWFGWSGWDPDWPAGPTNRYPYMGFGQYCVNCHASARDNSTFASLRNVEGQPGEPLVFLSQHFFDTGDPDGHHRLVTLPTDDAPRLGQPHYRSNAAFVSQMPSRSLSPTGDWPTWESVAKMPSETYDNVWVGAGGPTAADTFITSDQCVGCHDAGSTGLQFDMTAPNPHGDNLLNLSPYATWRTSPMGLGGRDPIFFAQLASETETFHPELAPLVQDTCLGCHGVLGQRQFAIDGAGTDTVACEDLDQPAARHRCFLRAYANIKPFPADEDPDHLARYAALARDGISCTACHRMLVGDGDGPALGRPENHGVEARQAFLNPDNEGFARTFTGSFLVGPPDEILGPFPEPKPKPMEHALGIAPVHDSKIRASELCGSCHTVHLPVLRNGKVIEYTYEQTTYPEWAFSDYRTGTTADGDPLPAGPGATPESCQQCHMPSKDANGNPYRSKIASIQEYSNFPQAEYNLGPDEIDLDVREGFARHTLVGLNVFLIKMAQQFPDILGIRTQDPMLVGRGLDPLLFTEQAMLDQASNDTATVTVDSPTWRENTLLTTVKIDSKVGHKFPSGVGFRRAFLGFEVADAAGQVLWASGRTNGAGVIVDEHGDPVAGELWWKDDCSARLTPGQAIHQPHYQEISAQDQVQIYQELVTAPADVADPNCGHDAVPGGALTTSFLSICGHVKDNRILPHGFLSYDDRVEIARALGAGPDLAEDTSAHAVGNDPDYRLGGGDSIDYEVDLSGIDGTPATVRATLYYQAIPPYYLQDRFCTSSSADTGRLYFLASHLNLDGTAADGWKLEVTDSGAVSVSVDQQDS